MPENVITELNEALRMQLTCINQCFLHARILKHRGLMELADGEFKESLDSMKFADQLVERILVLGGIPDMQPLGQIAIGEERASMLACDLQLKEEVQAQLAKALQACEAAKDQISAGLLKHILSTVQEHIRYIQEQRDVLDAA